MTVPVYLYFELICLLASLTLYLRKEIPLYLKVFPVLLAITLTVEIIGWLKSENGGDATMLFYLFSVFEFVFYFFILYHIIRTRKARRVVIYLMAIYPVLALFNIYFVQVNAIPSISYSLGCLLIVGICIYYFYELFHLPASVNLIREPAFWVCTGLLFYYICSFPLFGLSSLLLTASSIILQNISTILMMMNALLYTLFTVGFLCGLRIRKPDHQ
jgi:hypothetical protein